MKRKQYAITLLEIMIVLFLITLIGGVIGYNVKGSLDRGKKFKTEQAIDRIHDILLLEVAKGKSIEDAVKDPRATIKESGFVKKPEELLKDGWNQEFIIKLSEDGSDIDISSPALEAYNNKLKNKKDEKEGREIVNK